MKRAAGGSNGRLLAVDAGNSNIVFGVFSPDGKKILARVRLATQRDRTGDEYAALLEDRLRRASITPSSIGAVVIGSVVPPLDPMLASIGRDIFGIEPLFVEPGAREWIPMTVDNPGEVGADRILNALAARERHGAPAIVVDFGTATTFDVLSAEGAYAGGVIAPGLAISAEALFSRAAKLPRVEVRRPARVIGRETVECMQSGLFHGYVSLVRGILDAIVSELGGARPRVVATGGLAPVVGSEPGLFDVIDADLTLHGLVLAHRSSRTPTRNGRKVIRPRRR